MSERKPTKISETRKMVQLVLSNIITYKEGLEHIEQFARRVSPNATESSIKQVGARYRRMLKLNKGSYLIEFPHRGRKIKEAQPSMPNKRGKLTDVPHLDIFVDESITAAKPVRGRPRKGSASKKSAKHKESVKTTGTISATLLPEIMTDISVIPVETKQSLVTEQTLASNFIANAHNYPSDLNQTNDILRMEFNRIAKPIWKPSAKKKTTVPLVAPDRFNLNHPIWKYKAFTGAYTGMIELTPEFQPESQNKQTFPADPPYLSLYDMQPLYYTKDPFVELIEQQKKEQRNFNCDECPICINAV